MSARQYDEAISQYTIALSLNPVTPQDLLIRRGKANAATRMWENSLNDANEVAHFRFVPRSCMLIGTQAIELDPSSPLGYERKYEALLGAGYYGDAIDVFETMLSKMSESSDPEVRGKGNCVIMKSSY